MPRPRTLPVGIPFESRVLPTRLYFFPYAPARNRFALRQRSLPPKRSLPPIAFASAEAFVPAATWTRLCSRSSRIGGWLQALENGALLVVDEIEDSLHPLLTKRLIEMVQDNTINTEGAQLLFTTHDAMLLDLTFFRRDQIWFAEKDEKSCATELYSLASFSPRKGENIRKGYLQGHFGAIPFIGGDGL